jgi:hypothetical protein
MSEVATVTILATMPVVAGLILDSVTIGGSRSRRSGACWRSSRRQPERYRGTDRVLRCASPEVTRAFAAPNLNGRPSLWLTPRNAVLTSLEFAIDAHPQTMEHAAKGSPRDYLARSSRAHLGVSTLERLGCREGTPNGAGTRIACHHLASHPVVRGRAATQASARASGCPVQQLPLLEVAFNLMETFVMPAQLLAQTLPARAAVPRRPGACTGPGRPRGR